MRLRRPIAFILSAAVAASALTGCDSFSGHAAAAANSAQVQQLIEFIADLGLERDLRQALQSGGDLRQALLTLLGLESAANFNVDGLTGARPGQHAVQVWEVTAQSAEDAAALAASQIRAVLEQLKSNGVTAGRIGMVEVDGKYYVVVDVEVTEENTFEPVKPVSDDDDDSDDDGGEEEQQPQEAEATFESDKLTITGGSGTLNEETIEKLLSEDPDWKKSVTSINLLNSGYTQIGNSGDEYGAFEGCEKLTTVTLPSSVTTIGSFAFRDCNSLTSINLSNCTNLKNIESSAFYKCTNLTKIILPTSLESIGNWAFAYSDLTEINLNNCIGLESIDNNAFMECDSLEEINLSNCTNLKNIESSAFYKCTSLTKIILPTSLESIGNWAFAYSGLTSITLPASLEKIDDWAFFNCSGLKNIYFYTVPDTIGMHAFRGVNASDLTVYYPSSWGSDSSSFLNDLKRRLRGGGLSSLSEKQFQSFDPNELSTLTYLLDL